MKPSKLGSMVNAAPASQPGSDVQSFCLDIEIDDAAGALRVFDPRAFCPGRRGFCRRLLAAATRRSGVRKAEIDLDAASCRIEFGRGSESSQSMAATFVDSVREATAGLPAGGGDRWWWPAPSWSVLTAYPLAHDVSFWETLGCKADERRLRNERLPGSRAPLTRLVDAVAGLEGIEQCKVSPWFRTITIRFHPEGLVVDGLRDALEGALEELTAEQPTPYEFALGAPSWSTGGPVEVATGFRRLKYLALAGGSFALAVVAFFIPGDPTLPFLLATSYYLARSSPRLNERLHRAAFFGPILTEWEQYHGLSRSSKEKLIGFTLAIVIVTVVLTPVSVIALLAIFVVSSFSIYGVARLPGVQAPQAEASVPLGARARVALPAP
jgi:uncharacterized membrane protein YbaN (DUF454 family)